MKIFGIAGWKNSGKTTLMERLVSEISRRGHTVSTIKHAHHRFEIDKPGKDSHRHRKAGASEVLLASSRRWALMHELSGPEPDLHNLLKKLEPVDFVLVEGFKSANHPKIETRRRASRGPDLAPLDSSVLALASDYQIEDDRIPAFSLDDINGIADFILETAGAVGACADDSRLAGGGRCKVPG